MDLNAFLQFGTIFSILRGLVQVPPALLVPLSSPLLTILLTLRPFLFHCPFVSYRYCSSIVVVVFFYPTLFLKPLVCEASLPLEER